MYSNFINSILPRALKSLSFKNFLKALAKPLQDLAIAFTVMANDWEYRLLFSDRKIYLERFLNDQFDNLNRLIYIQSANPLRKLYIYQKAENIQPPYLYQKYNATTSYSSNVKVVDDDGKVYRALTSTLGNKPSTSPTQWVYHADAVIIRPRSAFANLAITFTVWVPTAVTASDIAIRRAVDVYNTAGRTFQIKRY